MIMDAAEIRMEFQTLFSKMSCAAYITCDYMFI